MGIIEALKGGWQNRKRPTHLETDERLSKSSHVELVQPSRGRIIELKVADQSDLPSKYVMSMLIAYAKAISGLGATYTVTENTVKIEFKEENLAEVVRKDWLA